MDKGGEEEEFQELLRNRKIIHISDIHIHNSDKYHITEYFSSIASFYKDEDPKPIIVLTGDIAEGVESEDLQQTVVDSYEIQFGIFNKIAKDMKDLGFKIVICPGNHDYPPNGDKNDEKLREIGDNFFKSFFGIAYLPKFPLKEEIDNFVFLILDSNDGEFSKVSNKLWDGSFGVEQLSNLGKLVQNIEHGKTVLVLFHHNPFCNPPGSSLTRCSKMINVIDESNVGKNNIIYMFGHHHKVGPCEYKMKQYPNMTFLMSDDSSNNVWAKDYGFTEISFKSCESDKRLDHELRRITIKVGKEEFEKVTEDYVYEIVTIEDGLPCKKGKLISKFLQHLCCCACF